MRHLKAKSERFRMNHRPNRNSTISFGRSADNGNIVLFVDGEVKIHRYVIMSFEFVALAEGSLGMNVLTNGLVLPIGAAVIRTTALSLLLPKVQDDMADVGSSQAEIDAQLGLFATCFEIALVVPSTTLLYKNPSTDAALG